MLERKLPFLLAVRGELSVGWTVVLLLYYTQVRTDDLKSTAFPTL